MKKKQRIGILNKGKNNTYINNSFSGFDISIQDEGENTFAKGNNFDREIRQKEKWYQKWWGQIFVGLIIVLAGGFILFKFGWN